MKPNQLNMGLTHKGWQEFEELLARANREQLKKMQEKLNKKII